MANDFEWYDWDDSFGIPSAADIQEANASGKGSGKGTGTEDPANKGWVAGRLSLDVDYDDTEAKTSGFGLDSGLSGRTIELIDADGDVVAITTTGVGGTYYFYAPAGEYTIQFPEVEDYIYAREGIGSEFLDSDADIDGKVAVTIVARKVLANIDASLQDEDAGPKIQSEGFYDDDGRDPEKDYLDFGEEGVEELNNFLESDDPRTLSGFFNNSNNPEFGAASQPFLRITPAEFGEDGAPRGVVDGVQTLPNEREISNVIADQDENNDGVTDLTHSLHGTNSFLTAFGQFFDHGLDFLQRSDDPNEKYYIPLDPSDELYRFSDDGNPFNDITSIRVTRGEEAINPATGEAYVPRAHINKTSPFIDQNQAYGSSDAVGYYLRLSATDENGNVIRNADGTIQKLAGLKSGIKDDAGYYNLPTYRDILINNGMSEAVIDAAIAANSFEMLMADPNFVDFRNVIDPKTGEPDGNPLLLDVAFDADPEGRAFNLEKLLIHYVAGDGRVNENIALTPIHTIFHRDHEHWVEVLREKDPSMSEEELFQSAKLIVGAEYQRIIFDEFIDALAGSLPGDVPHSFNGYQPRVDAQISEEFAHAVYRVGHSMVTEKITVANEDGTLDEISLVDAFLNPQQFEDIGTDSIISGNTRVTHERIDENLVDAVRNQLLGVASDLAAINLARGREVGLMSLNDVRKALYNNGSEVEVNGSDVTRALKNNEELRPYSDWDDFAKNLRDPSLVEQFKAVYDSVDDVDLWIGGLAEKPRSQNEGQMGTTFTWVFWEQMDRLQDGDKFYYEGFFRDSDILAMLENQVFSDIIMRNSDQEFLADSVFQLSDQRQMDKDQKDADFGARTETIIGNDLNNVIRAGGGDDTVYGQAGDDEILGEQGNDALRGEDGNDRLFGGDGDDRLVGGDGDDYLDGGDEQDAINGNAGNDIIIGGKGPDELHGNEGDDLIRGGEGDDTIKGGLGNDTLYGDEGRDRIETNGGDDIVFTGEGHDRVLMSNNEGYVTIEDFDKKEDRIDMDIFDIRTWEELQEKLTITEISGGTLLQIENSIIFLKDIDEKDLTQDNFKFDNDDQNLIINGRMDEGRIEVRDGEIEYIQPVEDGEDEELIVNEKSVGWKNAGDDVVDFHKIKGNTVIQLDAEKEVDEIYQLLPTRKGVEYKISFDAREGKKDSSTIEVLWNDQVIAEIEPDKKWTTNELKVTGTGGMDKISFRELKKEDDGKGAFLDNVIVAPADGEPLPYMLTGNGNATVYMDNHEVVEYIDGKGGEDTFQVRAPSTNYTLEDGGNSYTAIQVRGETIAFIKNVEKVVFEDAIYVQDDDGNFVLDDDNPGTIAGTDGNDYLVGTENDDIIDGKGGLDVIRSSSGDDTIFGGDAGYNQVDYEGYSSDYDFVLRQDGAVVVTKPNGTDILHDIHGIWFIGEGIWKPISELAEPIDDAINIIEGTEGDDYLLGTAGRDEIIMKGGLDVVRSSNGDDVILGGEGYNQVDYEGSTSDYTFTRNGDGTVTVEKPNGTDTLTDIGGVWFLGEGVWKSMNELVDDDNGGTDPGDGDGKTYEGTDGDDIFSGTSGDDTFNLGKGVDVVNGSAGDDIINGGEDYNQVDYDGFVADYTFSKNDDGSITVVKPNGTDTLTNIGGIWFKGEGVWMSMDDLTSDPSVPEGPETGIGTSGDDYLLGTDGDDVINGFGGNDVIRSSAGNDIIDGGGDEYDQVDYEGSASDYIFVKNDDGSFTVTDSNGDIDLLTDIDGIWFNGSGEWQDIDDLVT